MSTGAALSTPEDLRAASAHPGPLSAAATLVRLGRLLRALLMGAVCTVVFLLFVLPYAWMLLNSFRPEQEIFQYAQPLQWHTFVPVQFTLVNYVDIFASLSFGRYIFNSLLVAVAIVSASLLLNSMAAYALARINFRGRDAVFILTLIIMAVPLEATIIPLYISVRQMGIQDTYWALILPWIARPFNIFLLRQFFLQLPKELEEAATVDGCSRLRVYWNILMPNMVPALVTSALVDFLWSWDSFFWPLVVIQTPDLQVVQVAIASMNTPDRLYWGRIFASCTLVSLPVMIVFLRLQRYYIRGVVFSGIKG
jgi:ABC-type glycerol-3-phosphate transport system permease component